jgi:hypothetical protein
MPESDLTHLTPDAAHVGVNIARTIRVVAKLLFDWCGAEQARKEKPETSDRDGTEGISAKSPSYLTTIYFDKLATLYCRLWSRLHDDYQVRYGAGFIQRRGWHGPGQALRINRTEDEKYGMGRNPEDYRRYDWAFTTEVIEKLTPAIGKARGLFKLDRNAWDPKCRVYPQLEGSVWDSWCFACETEKDEALFLDRRELTLTLLISSAIVDLSKEELRAIGTHCSASETCKDIIFNLAEWVRDFDSVLKAIKGTSVPEIEVSALRLVTISYEVWRKSIDNKNAYESAYNKFIKRISTQSALLQAFKAVQASASLIWQNDRVKKYANVSSILFGFSVYCRRVLSILGIIDGLGAQEIAESDEQLTNLKHWCQKKALTLFDYKQVPSKTSTEIVTLFESIRKEIQGEMPEEDL